VRSGAITCSAGRQGVEIERAFAPASLFPGGCQTRATHSRVTSLAAFTGEGERSCETPRLQPKGSPKVVQMLS